MLEFRLLRVMVVSLARKVMTWTGPSSLVLLTADTARNSQQLENAKMKVERKKHKCCIILWRCLKLKGTANPTWLVFQNVSSETSIVVNWWAPFQSERVQTRVDYTEKRRRPWD